MAALNEPSQLIIHKVHSKINKTCQPLQLIFSQTCGEFCDVNCRLSEILTVKFLEYFFVSEPDEVHESNT